MVSHVRWQRKMSSFKFPVQWITVISRWLREEAHISITVIINILVNAARVSAIIEYHHKCIFELVIHDFDVEIIFLHIISTFSHTFEWESMQIIMNYLRVYGCANCGFRLYSSAVFFCVCVCAMHRQPTSTAHSWFRHGKEEERPCISLLLLYKTIMHSRHSLGAKMVFIIYLYGNLWKLPFANYCLCK